MWWTEPQCEHAVYVVDSDDYPYTTVDQKFMTVGLSYLPNDRDLGSIETARRKENHIYVPQDWYNLVQDCRRNNPFRVSAMTQADFVSLEPVAKCIVNRKLNTFKQNVKWLNTKWIRITKEKPLQFQYRYTLNELENWKTVDLRKRGKGRPSLLGRIQLPHLYQLHERSNHQRRKTSQTSYSTSHPFTTASTTSYLKGRSQEMKKMVQAKRKMRNNRLSIIHCYMASNKF